MKLVNIGDGRAAERIVELLDDFFRQGDGEKVVEQSTRRQG